ncbi:unnamed protein product [Leptosia nina]|uniref:Uncharacterized protein n=1 Tax=Leptosia nina TaxID=320188 RepID=A0AAV1JRX6_9NEOP
MRPEQLRLGEVAPAQSELEKPKALAQIAPRIVPLSDITRVPRREDVSNVTNNASLDLLRARALNINHSTNGYRVHI